MFTADPAPAIVDRVRAVKFLRERGMPVADLALVDEVIDASDPAAAVVRLAAGSLFDSASTAIAEDGEACRMLGIPQVRSATSFRIWRTAGDTCVAMAGFSIEWLRSAAREHFSERPECRCWRGIPLPQEVVRRLDAAGNPALGAHLLRTAADHMAEHVISLVLELPGTSRDANGAVWTASCSPAGLADAFAWLALPGPGQMASYVHAFVPEDAS